MFLATFSLNGKTTWGAVDKKTNLIYPIEKILGKDAPRTLLDYITQMCSAPAKKPDFENLTDGIPVQNVKLLAPLPNPIRNVFCVGKNYLDHVKELSSFDINQFSLENEIPIFFTKATTCINEPYGNVSMHVDVTNQVDYEAELAVIIGRVGKNIKAKDAGDYIFGYTLLNDFTARDMQKDHKQWFKGKSLDGYCPMGPWIATKNEINDPHNLDIASYVNGEMRQNSNTKNMIFQIGRLIEDLSKGMTLLPGDILATGTPSGVGAGFNPPKFLKKGDKVKVVVEGIGEIENKMV